MATEYRLGKPMWHPAALIATWFGSGLLPWISGTWGSLAALPFAWLILWYGGPMGLLVAAVAAFLIGWWASVVVLRGQKVSDPGEIVIDEVAGQFLVLVIVPPDLLYFLAGFLLFRAADIFKPWPASWADRRVKGGLGVMLDDIFAAFYAMAVLYGLRLWWG